MALVLVQTLPKTYKSQIVAYSYSIGIAPCILVGRLLQGEEMSTNSRLTRTYVLYIIKV